MKRFSFIASVILVLASCVKDTVTAPIAPTGPIDPGNRELIHYWNFNTDDTSVMVLPDSTIGGGAIITYNAAYIDAVDPGTSINVRNGDDSLYGLRVRNPSTDITFKLPTTGYKQALFTFAVQRSNNGAQQNTITYTINGHDFISSGLSANVVNTTVDWTAYSIDFSGIAGVDDNPNFAIRLSFSAGNDGTSGNCRYDNVTLDALPK